MHLETLLLKSGFFIGGGTINAGAIQFERVH